MITGLKNMMLGLIVLIWLVFPMSATATGYRLAIDPAHGGKDPGVKFSRSLTEKDVTLAIARLVRENLSNADDIKVQLTRSDDRDLSLAERKKIIERSDADILISIHMNAGFGDKAEGYKIYHLGIPILSAQTGKSVDILKNMGQTMRVNKSVLLAQIVQKEMGMVFPRKGRGLRDAPVQLLQSLKMPAILLEVGFSTGIEDRKKLKDTEIQEAIANALTRSVKKYFLTGGAS